MLKLLLLITLVLLGGLGLAYLHNADSYMLLTLGNISIETSVGVALGLLLLLALLLWLLYSLLRGLFSIPGGIAHNWRWWRKSHRQHHLNQLTLKLVSGELIDTNALLSRLSDRELGSFERLAVAVRAKLQGGNPKSAHTLLQELETRAQNNERKQLAMRLRAEYWLKCGEFAPLAGIELPRKLKNKPFWRETIATAAVATGKWHLLYQQLNAGKDLDRRFWKEGLEHADSSKLLDSIWACMPVLLKDQPAMAKIYLERLLSSGRTASAQNLLLEAAHKPALFELLPALGSFKPERGDKLLKQLEKRYNEQHSKAAQDHAQLGFFNLGLGKLCARLQLTGKAEDYLAPLLDHANPRIARQANFAMAHLLASREEYATAFAHLQNADPEGVAMTLSLPKDHDAG